MQHASTLRLRARHEIIIKSLANHWQSAGTTAAPIGRWLSPELHSPILLQHPSLPLTGKAERQLAGQPPVGGQMWLHLLILGLQVGGLPRLQPCVSCTLTSDSPTCLTGTTQPTWPATPLATRDPAQWRSATTQRSRRARWARPAAMAGPRHVAAGVGCGLGCPGMAAEVSSAAAAGQLGLGT